MTVTTKQIADALATLALYLEEAASIALPDAAAARLRITQLMSEAQSMAPDEREFWSGYVAAGVAQALAADTADDADETDELKRSIADLNRAQQRVRDAVAAARAGGTSWDEVGAAIGFTGLTAQRRFGSRADRQQAHFARVEHDHQIAAAKTCPRCGAKSPCLRDARVHTQTCAA